MIGTENECGMGTPRPMTHKRQSEACDIQEAVEPRESVMATLRDLEAGGLPPLPVKTGLLRWHRGAGDRDGGDSFL